MEKDDEYQEHEDDQVSMASKIDMYEAGDIYLELFLEEEEEVGSDTQEFYDYTYYDSDGVDTDYIHQQDENETVQKEMVKVIIGEEGDGEEGV